MALTTAQAVADQVSLAYFGRPQDTGALAIFGAGLVNGGPTAAQLAAQFATAESKVVFGANATMSSVIAKSFELVGRVATTQNITDIATWANANKLDISQMPWEIMKIALSTESLLPQASQVAWARLAVAYQFSEDVTANATALQNLATSTTSQDAARVVISGVTSFATIALAYPATGAGTVANFIAGTSVVAGTTFTLTSGSDNFTGTAGNDTFNGVIDQATPANSTIGAGDSITGGAGTDTLNITGVGTTLDVLNGALVTGVEVVNIRAATANTLDASQIAGLTAVNANLGAGTVGITKLATGATVGVIGNGTITNGAVTFAYATATDAATINLSGGTKVGTTITNNSATATTATINSTGAANTIGAVDLSTAATMTTLTVNATTALTATLVDADYVATGAALTVTGAGAVNLGAPGVFKTVDASANTGGVTMTLDTVTTSFKGSATANDTITTVTLATPAAGIIDGGASTADTLVVAAVADVATAPLKAAYTGFEVLNNAAGASLAADGIAGVTSLITSSAAGGFSAMTAAQAASISVTATLGGTATTYALTTATGTSDVLGLNFKGGTTAAPVVVNATSLVVNGFETLNLTAASAATATTTNTGKSIYNVNGTTLATAGTDYDSFAIGTATTDLKTVTLAGDFAAKIDLSANATKVTAINASANTAGANIVTGGQTGALVVTGTESRDTVAMGAAGAGGLVTINAGGGNDNITALQADVAVATINGGAGTDTLTLSDAGTVTINDNNFAGVSAIEKLVFSAVTGLNFVSGGFANAIATANAGVLDIADTALVSTAAVVVDVTGLSAGNSLKLSLKETAATAAVSETITMSTGADSITIAKTATSTGTITISGGVAALAATTVKTVDLSGVAASGAIAVTTGAGNDVIKAAAVAGTYTGGLGADTFTAGAGVDTFAMGTNGSVAGTSMDVVVGYGLGADIFTFGGALTLLGADATGLVAGVNVQQSAGGLVTFATADNTLALKIAAVQADVQLDAAGSIAVFNDGVNAYVYYAGAAIGNTDDQIIQLTGVTAASVAANGIVS